MFLLFFRNCGRVEEEGGGREERVVFIFLSLLMRLKALLSLGAYANLSFSPFSPF